MSKISRYLDVTRSALLFGNRAILVEGVAEALLLPVMARHATLRLQPEEWHRFKATPIIAIDGVDFRPYVEVLLRAHDGVRVADSVILITDADPVLQGNRKADLEALAATLEAAANLHVLTNNKTLEYDLFEAGNEALLRQAFLKLHPRLEDEWKSRVAGERAEARADAFLKLLAEKRVRKGDFAQEVASLIERGSEFHVPAYLERAIRKAGAA
jgi:putative ATP-dependent endonuclease of OLD family